MPVHTTGNLVARACNKTIAPRSINARRSGRTPEGSCCVPIAAGQYGAAVLQVPRIMLLHGAIILLDVHFALLRCVGMLLLVRIVLLRGAVVLLHARGELLHGAAILLRPRSILLRLRAILLLRRAFRTLPQSLEGCQTAFRAE